MRDDVSNNSAYDIQNFNNFYCFDWPDGGLTTGGLFNHQRVQYICILVKNCHAAPKEYLVENNITCSKNMTALKDIFNKYLYFAVIVQNSIIDIDDYNDPFKLTFNYFYDALEMETMKKSYYFMQKSVLRDNIDWIIETRNHTELIGL